MFGPSLNIPSSRSSHQFSQVPKAEIPRAQFNRSSTVKTTFDAGKLIPFFCDEVLPGDTFNLKATLVARFTTLAVPIMDNMYLDTQFFFVPNRLLWENWKKFMGEQKNPGDSTDYLVPQLLSPVSPSGPAGFENQSLFDYLGVPTQVQGLSINALFPRACNLIYNEWYRDQNLQDSVPVNIGDGPDDYTDYNVMRRGKRHDYFTSGLPFAQKGAAVTIPLGTTAEVKRIKNAVGPVRIMVASTETASPGGTQVTDASGNLQNTGAAGNVTIDPNNTLYADLTTASASTINALRESFAIQRLFERDARGGTRYTEIIQAHFGVVSPDARQQRPEYLGGGSTPITISPIANTSTGDSTNPQGNLAAIGTLATSPGEGHGFIKSFTEHGILIGFLSVRADLNYQQGLNKMFSRQTKYDYYWPALSHLGEQPVLNKEIYAQGIANPSADEAVFCYQEAYADYRYKPNIITAKMRSNDPQSLDAWHLAQDFGVLPTLSDTFIVENPPVARVVAVENEPNFKLDGFLQLICTRPMPLYSVPGLIDHF